MFEKLAIALFLAVNLHYFKDFINEIVALITYCSIMKSKKKPAQTASVINAGTSKILSIPTGLRRLHEWSFNSVFYFEIDSILWRKWLQTFPPAIENRIKYSPRFQFLPKRNNSVEISTPVRINVSYSFQLTRKLFAHFFFYRRRPIHPSCEISVHYVRN